MARAAPCHGVAAESPATLAIHTMRKRHLLTPGPTPVPEDLRLAMAGPPLHHRSPEFRAILREARELLAWAYQTAVPPVLVGGSGTAGMEAAVVNFLSPGDTAIVVTAGKFGERFARICEASGVRTERLDVAWGRAVEPEAVAEALARRPEARAVLVQASESSTGVAHPVREIAALVRERPEALIVVDAITALGVYDLPTDAWGLDVVVGASQKAFSLPPGLAFISVSEKAWRLAERARLPRFYLDLGRERAAQERGETAFTAITPLVIGLRASLRRLHEEGLPQIFARHDRLARAARAAASALGLPLFARPPATSITAIGLPDAVDGVRLLEHARAAYGVEMAGGQDRLRGRIVRIAHLGDFDPFDILTQVATLEMSLADLGHPVSLGAGCGAAAAVLRAGGGDPGTTLTEAGSQARP